MMLALALVSSALAHGTHGANPDEPTLHVGYDYESCYIDLHPELRRSSFRTFTRQFADAGAFSSMAGAAPLGGAHVAVGVTLQGVDIDDSIPAWNDTFTHPGDDHWLGQPRLPILQGRVGLSQRVDAELLVTGDPASNWALVGGAVRHALVRSSEKVPVDVSARLSVVHLLGAPELNHDNATAELLVSRTFGPVTPYLGVAGVAARSEARTDEVDLSAQVTGSGRGVVGAELALGPARLAAHATLAAAPSAALMVGAAF